jgi:hypothetical protein
VEEKPQKGRADPPLLVDGKLHLRPHDRCPARCGRIWSRKSS